MQRAILKLFNAVLVDEPSTKGLAREVIERATSHGYFLDPAIAPDSTLLECIESVVGISGEKANAAFHKSWDIVRNSPMETLVQQQIIHYLSTYGLESLGIYQQEFVYIPHEVLTIPEIEESVPLIVIKAINSADLKDAIVNLSSGIALAPETLADVFTIIEACKFDVSIVDKIGNRELKTMLYDFYGVVPQEPVEYLRHLVSKLTDETLLIKNQQLIDKLKSANGKFLDTLLLQAPSDLPTIFFRYKPLFLAMKTISRNKAFFNRLRKQASEAHVALPGDYLNNITAQIKQRVLNQDQLQVALKTASIFRKIRLAYALHHRLQGGDSIIYKVRNGRGFATDFNWPSTLYSSTQQALDIVLDSIASDLRKKMEGATVFIPPAMKYSMPASEKQFTGHFPSGSSVVAPTDMIVGVHWG